MLFDVNLMFLQASGPVPAAAIVVPIVIMLLIVLVVVIVIAKRKGMGSVLKYICCIINKHFSILKYKDHKALGSV